MHQIEHEFVRRIVLRVDAQFSYPTENRILFRFAANRTPICTGNRICVDSPLPCNTYVHLVLTDHGLQPSLWLQARTIMFCSWL
jgi:hypothetical protein